MISHPALRRLSEVRQTDAAEVGGKAASLGELLAGGVRVPDGVVLTAAATEMTDDERRSLMRGAAQLGAGPFAVRSSGVAEDGAEHSYAGIYETVLDVPAGGLTAAIDRCLASAHAPRVAEYQHAGNGRMAVIIQRMVKPTAAGVALTADPISGDRHACVITAVRGVGERLVSGAAFGDEWLVRDSSTTARRRPESAIDRRQALRVAREARRIAEARGTPQDIEWAIDADDTLWILQARPMTALPPEVSWESPARGAYTRQLRFGEWISEPVTPLFESWLLSAMEERLHGLLLKWLGQRAPRPHHVIVNGWYFYSLNWFSPRSMLRSLPSIVVHVLRDPRFAAGVAPPTVRYAIPIMERMWRDDLQPRYRAAVAAAEARVETSAIGELPGLIDELADLSGEYFTSIAGLSGAAYKMEINLARFYRKHLAASLGGSHLSLLAGFEPPTGPDRHAVVSLDWWHPPAQLAESARPADHHAHLVETRQAAEAAAFAILAGSPKRLRAFKSLLAETQRLVPVREEQTRELTIAWPVMRRAVVRIGEALVGLGAIAAREDVFFLTRTEALTALGGEALPTIVNVAERRATRESQARLVPPSFVGEVSRFMRSMPDMFARMIGADPSDRAIVSGSPASPGRATGAVRVIRGTAEFDDLQPGEILVAPLTAPAWTPLFTRAAAVVTDVGSAASHASIIAREYGIPAVVGCGDATARLRTGMRVTVDGSTGNVEPE
jgi:phosphohistidine swiveling domain-containing protein